MVERAKMWGSIDRQGRRDTMTALIIPPPMGTASSNASLPHSSSSVRVDAGSCSPSQKSDLMILVYDVPLISDINHPRRSRAASSFLSDTSWTSGGVRTLPSPSSPLPVSILTIQINYTAILLPCYVSFGFYSPVSRLRQLS